MKRKIKDYDSYVIIKGKNSQFQAFTLHTLHMHVEIVLIQYETFPNPLKHLIYTLIIRVTFLVE